MAKTISVGDSNYEWLVSESGRQTAKQRKKVSIDEIIGSLIKNARNQIIP